MFEEEKKVLAVALSTMGLPEQRRNLENEENILWLSRNLGIQNSSHRHFEQAMGIIKTILKNENK